MAYQKYLDSLHSSLWSSQPSIVITKCKMNNINQVQFPYMIVDKDIDNVANYCL